MRAATLLGAAFLAALTASACGRGVNTSQSASASDDGRVLPGPAHFPATDASTSSATAPKRLTLTYDKAQHPKPVVGTNVDVTADGLPPNKTVTLAWGTVEGGWVI